MYCKKCGTWANHDGMFCERCGNSLEMSGGSNIENESDTKEIYFSDKRHDNRKRNVIIAIIISCTVGLAFLACGLLWLFNTFNTTISKIETVSTDTIYTGSLPLDIKVMTKEEALAALDTVSDLYGFESAASEFALLKTDTVDGDTYYRFAQIKDNITVEGKTMVVAVDDQGNVFSISGNYYKFDKEKETKKDISNTESKMHLSDTKAKAEIEKQVKKELKNGYEISQPELVYKDSKLSWKFIVSGYTKDDELTMYIAYLYKTDGRQHIVVENQIIYDQVQKELNGYNDGVQNITVEEFKTTDGVKHYQLQDKKRNIYIYEPIDKYYWYWTENDGIKDGKNVRQAVSWKDGETADKSGVDAMANVSRAYDYFSNVLNHKGLDGNGSAIPVYIHISDRKYEKDGKSEVEQYHDNAFYSPSLKSISFTKRTKNIDGDIYWDENGIEFSANLDSAAHEYTHGVVDAISSLGAYGEPRAVHEGYADIFGECVEDSLGNYKADWNIGKRSLEAPSGEYLSKYDPNRKIENEDDCYKFSTIISHAAYLMWQGDEKDGAINDTELLAKLWYDSIYMLNPESGLSDCRTAVEISAKRLFSRNMLTIEQVRRVSEAFNQVEIEPKYLYELVSPGAQLVVYSAGNSQYYNYHYNIEKLSSVGGEAKTDEIYNEDVTDKGTVILNQINYDAIYKITVTDLSETSGTPQTKVVMVGQAGKNELAFYTDYVPPVSDTISRIVEKLDTVDSVHLKHITNSDYSYMKRKVNMTMEMESDVSITKGCMHSILNVSMGNAQKSSELYIKSGTGSSDVYMYTNKMWIKQNISTSDIYKLGTGFDGVEGIKFFLNSLEGAYMEEKDFNDIRSIMITGRIGTSSTEEALKKSGLSTLIDQFSNGFLTEDQISYMLSGLSSIKFTIYVNQENYLPIQVDLDMTETTESIYENIKELAARDGEEITFSINTNTVTIIFSEYNSNPDINIPAEALQGMEYKIIK